MLRSHIFERFDKELRRQLRGGGVVCEAFSRVAESLFTDAMSAFRNRVRDLLPFEDSSDEADWSEHIVNHESDLA